jgi:hypothetical protein
MGTETSKDRFLLTAYRLPLELAAVAVVALTRHLGARREWPRIGDWSTRRDSSKSRGPFGSYSRAWPRIVLFEFLAPLQALPEFLSY